MMDSLVVILLIFMGLRDDRLAPGDPQTSLFRTRDVDGGAADYRRGGGAWDHTGGDNPG